MAGAKIEKTKQAAMQLIDQLTPQDNLALIEFDDTVDILFPSQHVLDREALKAAIRRALRRPRQIPDGLGFFSYEKFSERLQHIIGGLRVESVSAA